jgi:hypothetical protein
MSSSKSKEETVLQGGLPSVFSRLFPYALGSSVVSVFSVTSDFSAVPDFSALLRTLVGLSAPASGLKLAV